MTILAIILGLMFAVVSVGVMALIFLFWVCDMAAAREEKDKGGNFYETE